MHRSNAAQCFGTKKALFQANGVYACCTDDNNNGCRVTTKASWCAKRRWSPQLSCSADIHPQPFGRYSLLAHLVLAKSMTAVLWHKLVSGLHFYTLAHRSDATEPLPIISIPRHVLSQSILPWAQCSRHRLFCCSSLRQLSISSLMRSRSTQPTQTCLSLCVVPPQLAPSCRQMLSRYVQSTSAFTHRPTIALLTFCVACLLAEDQGILAMLDSDCPPDLIGSTLELTTYSLMWGPLRSREHSFSCLCSQHLPWDFRTHIRKEQCI